MSREGNGKRFGNRAESLLGYQPTHGITSEPPNKGTSVQSPKIQDSGNRREFESGAVRDIQEGKGRCDLLPLLEVADLINSNILHHINNFIRTGECVFLYAALEAFNDITWENKPTMMLEVSKHFEEGAKKYGDNNWRKGIPAHCYIDSAVRHYLKWLRCDEDEPHDRAVAWNLLCCIWTCENKPELNEYKQAEDK